MCRNPADYNLILTEYSVSVKSLVQTVFDLLLTFGPDIAFGRHLHWMCVRLDSSGTLVLDVTKIPSKTCLLP